MSAHNLTKEMWSSKVVYYLKRVYEAALESDFPRESMIVAGVEELVEIFSDIPEDDIMLKFQIALRIAESLMFSRSTIYETAREIIKNFQYESELALAIIDLLEVVVVLPYESFSIMPIGQIDNNIQRLITNPEAKYNEEFIHYNDYIEEHWDEHDEENELEREIFNEAYQNLAPPKEIQLERLKKELSIELCEECQMPTKNQGCDCWLLEIEGY